MTNERTDRRSAALRQVGAGKLPIAFRLPRGVVDAVDERAARAGVSRNWMVEMLLKRSTGMAVDEVEAVYMRKADEQLDLFS